MPDNMYRNNAGKLHRRVMGPVGWCNRRVMKPAGGT